MVIPLPKKIKRHPKIINVDNYDENIYNKIVDLVGKYPDIHPVSYSNFEFSNPIFIKSAQKWLLDNGLYQFPTIELIEWLKNKIGSRTAIEICAGHGWLGDNLNIKSTDGYIFDHPAMKLRSEIFGIQNCVPLSRVERLTADVAVFKYKPQVVIGCYVTHLWDNATKTGSALGVNDEDIFSMKNIEQYILIGAKSVHQHRPFLKKKHETFQAPWLLGRGEEARIWVWSKQETKI